MAIIRKKLGNSHFTMIDNMVAKNKNLSDMAVRLYLFLAGFNNSFQMNDAYIEKSLSWSHSKVTRVKRELKNADLILVEKVDRSLYFMYIGTSQSGATIVRNNWNKVNPDGRGE
jgi:hypothetical protein